MVPRAGLDWCGKLCPPTELRYPDRPPHTEFLYRLHNPSLQFYKRVSTKKGSTLKFEEIQFFFTVDLRLELREVG